MPNTIEGRLYNVKGTVKIIRDNKQLSVNTDDPIYESDIIITSDDSSADIIFRDGTKSRISENSEIKLADFEFGEVDSSFLMNIVQGSVRTMSGEIVKLNPEAFEIVTPRATIGIRGTEFVNIVEQGFEHHALLFLSEGHVMLVTSKDGTTNELTSPLEVATLADSSQGQILIEEFTLSQMLDLIKGLAPMLVPNLGYGSLDLERLAEEFPLSKTLPYEEVEKIEEENLRDQSLEYEHLYSNLHTKQLILVESDSPDYSRLVEALEQNTIDYELLPSDALTESFLDSTIFDDDIDFLTPDESIAPVAPPVIPVNPPISGGVFNYGATDDTVSFNQELINSDISLGAGHDTLSISENYSDGFITGGDGNDVITLAKNLDDPTPGMARSLPFPVLDAGSGDDYVSINHLVNGNIVLKDGNDTININQMTAGNIDGGAGNDILINEDAKSLNSINFEVFISGSDASSLTSSSHLTNMGFAFAGNDLSLSNQHWHIYNDTVSAKNADITLESTLNINELAHFVDLANSSKDISTSNLDDTINISSNSTHNINTLNGNDTINISQFSNGILASGEGDDSLTVNTFTGGEAHLEVGDDTFIVDNLQNGIINTGFNDDFVLIKNYTGGSIEAELGDDVLVGKDLTRVQVSGFEVFIYGNDAEEISSKSALSNFGVTLNAGTVLLSDKWTLDAINNVYTYLGKDITLSSTQPVLQYTDSTIQNTTQDITSGNLADYIHISNNATHNVTTLDGDDTVIINNSSNNIVDTGNHNDSITITSSQNTDINSGAGSDYIEITSHNIGDITTDTGADKINIQNFIDGSLESGNDNDSIYIKTFSAGEIDAGSGNDTINIQTLTSGTVDSYSGSDHVFITTMNGGTLRNYSTADTVTVTNFNNGTITGSSGSDVFHITNMNNNAYLYNNSTAGSDSIYITNMNNGRIYSNYSSFLSLQNYIDGTINLNGSSDFLLSKQDLTSIADIKDIENFLYGSEAMSILSYDELSTYGIVLNSNRVIQSLSADWIEDKGVYKHKDYDLYLESVNLNQNIELDNTIANIETALKDDFITIHNTASHTINTNAGDDLIRIGTLSSSLDAGNDNDTIKINNLTGTLESGSGNDSINIDILSGTLTNSYTSDTISVVTQSSGSIIASGSNDLISVTNFNGGTIDSSSGSDSIYITNFNGGSIHEKGSSSSYDFIYVENYIKGSITADSENDFLISKQDLTDISSIKGFESYLYGDDADLLTSFADFLRYGITVNSSFAITSLSSDWVESNGIYKLNGYELYLESQFLNNSITLENTNKDITTYDGADNITINHLASHNITTNNENDTVSIGTLNNSATINTGNDDDSITINHFTSGTIQSGSGADSITITTMENGSIENSSGNDTIKITNLNNGTIKGSGSGESYYITNFNSGTLDSQSGEDSIYITNMDGGTINETTSATTDHDFISIENYISGTVNAYNGNDILISKENLKNNANIKNIESFLYGDDALLIKSSEDLIKFGIVLNSSSVITELSSDWSELSTGIYKYYNKEIYLESSLLNQEITLENTIKNITTPSHADSITITNEARHAISTNDGNDSVSVINSYSTINTGSDNDFVFVENMHEGSISLSYGNDFLVIKNYIDGKLYASSGTDFLVTEKDISANSNVYDFENFIYGSKTLEINNIHDLAAFGITVDKNNNISSLSDKWHETNGIFKHEDYDLYLKSSSFGETIELVNTSADITTGSFNDTITITGIASHDIKTFDGSDYITIENLNSGTIDAGNGNNVIDVNKMIGGTIRLNSADALTIDSMSGGNIYGSSYSETVRVTNLSQNAVIDGNSGNDSIYITNMDGGEINAGTNNDFVYVENYISGEINGYTDNDILVSKQDLSENSQVVGFAAFIYGSEVNSSFTYENLYTYGIFTASDRTVTSLSDKWKENNGIFKHDDYELYVQSEYLQQNYNLSNSSYNIESGDLGDIITITGTSSHNIYTYDGNDTINLGTHTAGTVNAGSGTNSVIIDTLQGGSINSANGVDTVSITSMTNGTISNTYHLEIDSMSGGTASLSSSANRVEIGSLTQNAEISTNSGNDSIYITDMLGGEINAGYDNDFVYIENYTSGKVYGGADNDILISKEDLSNKSDITSFESFVYGADANLILNFDSLAKYGIKTSSSREILSLSSEWTENNGTFSHDSLDLHLKSDFLSQHYFLENTFENITTGLNNDSITISNTSSHNITTDTGNDTVIINILNSHIINTGSDNDFIEITTMNNGTVNSASGNDTIHIDSMYNGTISSSDGSDVITIELLSGNSTISAYSGNDTVRIDTMENGEIDLYTGNDFLYLGNYIDGEIDAYDGADILVSIQDLSTETKIENFESYLYGSDADLISSYVDLAKYGIYSNSSNVPTSLSSAWQEDNGVFTHNDYDLILKSTYLPQHHIFENTLSEIHSGVNNDTISISNNSNHDIYTYEGNNLIEIENLLSGSVNFGGYDTIFIENMQDGAVKSDYADKLLLNIGTMHNGQIAGTASADFIKILNYNGGSVNAANGIDVVLSLEDLSLNSAFSNTEIFIFGNDIDLLDNYASLASYGINIGSSEGSFNLSSDWIVKEHSYTHKEHDISIKTLFIASDIYIDNSTDNIVTQDFADTVTVNYTLSHSLTTNDGEDYIIVNTAQNATISSGDDNDTITVATSNNSSINSGFGDDFITVTDFNGYYITSSEGNDTIHVTNFNSGSIIISDGDVEININTMLKGSISTDHGDDFLSIASYTAGTINLDTGDDILVSIDNLSTNPSISNVETFIYGANAVDITEREKLADFGIQVDNDGNITLSAQWTDDNGIYTNNDELFIQTSESVNILTTRSAMPPNSDNTAEDAYTATINQASDII